MKTRSLISFDWAMKRLLRNKANFEVLEGFLFIVLLLMFCMNMAAQKTGMQSLAMKHGENYNYDIKFKWGFSTTHAGDATFNYKADNSVTGATSQLQLSYKSSKFFDAFFRMRDTLTGYYNDNNTLIYSFAQANQGNYRAIDKLTFFYETERTNIKSYRFNITRGVEKFDTLLTTVGEVADMLGVFYFIRGLNRKLLQTGDIFPITVAVGKDLVKVQFIYQNQAIVEYDNAKYNTHYFKIDIFDDAFESTKSAAEVWISDDGNFLPVKLRTKLKLGYAEVYYKNSSGLAHPFSSRIANSR